MAAKYSNEVAKKKLKHPETTKTVIPEMRIIRSIDEKGLIVEKRTKPVALLNSPEKMKHLNMQKAKSFKQSRGKKDLSDDSYSKGQSYTNELSEGSKLKKHPSTNRADSSSKDLLPIKKSKVRIRRKCCAGKGG